MQLLALKGERESLLGDLRGSSTQDNDLALQTTWHRVAHSWNPRLAWKSLLPQSRRQGRLAPLDGARALAMLWVIFFHTIFQCMEGLEIKGPDGELTTQGIAGQWLNSWATQPWQNGDAGVDIFFVLSGFLIGHLWLKEVVQTGAFRYWRFLLRRFLRIWPMLVVLMVLTWMINVILHTPTPQECRNDWWHMLLFIDNYFAAECPMALSWTVATEFQFYLASPFIMWLSFSPQSKSPRRFGLAFLAASSLVGVAVNAALMATKGPAAFANYATWPPPFSYLSPITRSPPYFAGMLASMVVMLQQREASSQQLPSMGGHGLAQSGLGSTMQLSKSEELESNNSEVQTPSAPAPTAAGALLGISLASGQRKRWRQHLLVSLDLLAVLVGFGLAFFGLGSNMWTQRVLPSFNKVLQVAGRWAFGWVVAAVFIAVLLGRLRVVKGVLSCRLFVPIAALSYSSYLLQKKGWLFLPTWRSAGVTNMFAALTAGLCACIATSAMALAMALPCYLLVERPLMQLLPRA